MTAGSTAAPAPFLVEGAVQLVVNALLVAPGIVRLDATGLVFKRSGGLSGRLAPADGPVLPLAAIQASTLDSGVLTLKDRDGRTHRMRGGVVPQIAAALCCLGVPLARDATPFGADAGSVSPVACTLQTGPLFRVGHLVVGPAGLAFAPSGSVDLSLGSWPLFLPRGTIRKVVNGPERLSITHDDGVVELAHIKSPVAARGLGQTLRPRAGRVPRDPWRSPALLVRSGGQQDRGELWLESKSELMFDAGGGEESLGSIRDSFVVGEVGFARHLDGGRQGWRAWVIAEPDAIEVLEDVVGQLPPGRPPDGEGVRVATLAKGLEAVRVIEADGQSRTLRPAALVAGEHTLDLVVYDTPENQLEEGVQVRLELQSARKRWYLKVCPWRVRETAIETLSERDARFFLSGEPLVRVQLPWPRKDQVDGVANRRGSVRVVVADELMEVEVDGRRSPAQLQSLSSGGASLVVRRPLHLGARVGCVLDVPDLQDPVLADVVWLRPFAGGSLVGLRFVDSSERFVEQLQAVVYKVELLLAQGEEAPLRRLKRVGEKALLR